MEKKNEIKRNNVISISVQRNWWIKRTSAWDRGGSFNIDLYLRFCKAQLNRDYEKL